MQMIWVYDRDHETLNESSGSIGVEMKEVVTDQNLDSQVVIAVAGARTKNQNFFVTQRIKIVFTDDARAIHKEGEFDITTDKIKWN